MGGRGNSYMPYEDKTNQFIESFKEISSEAKKNHRKTLNVLVVSPLFAMNCLRGNGLVMERLILLTNLKYQKVRCLEMFPGRSIVRIAINPSCIT